MSSFVFYLLIVLAFVALALAVLPLRPVTRGYALLAFALAVVGVGAVLRWPAPAVRTAPGSGLLDSALPSYHFAERHRTRICAAPQKIAEAIKQTRPGEIAWLGFLSVVRGLSTGSGRREKPVLDAALESNFVLLADTPIELVLATGGEFWRYRASVAPDAPLRQKLLSAQGDVAAFAALDLGGRPKAVFNFAVAPAPFGCQYLTTETRIYAADPSMLARFAAYWRVIQPGSALLRRSWLNAIRHRAEAKR